VLFNSHLFLFAFLPVAVIGFALFARWTTRTATMIFLIVASLVFYGWWNWRYVLLLGGSILFNYSWALLLHRDSGEGAPRLRRLALAFGIAVNLGVLGYFKYAGFFVDTLNAALAWDWYVRRIGLPVAISFFTFEQIAYLVDTYRRQVPAHGFLSYSVFLTFFPRLIAGPIVRPHEILPQLARAETFAFSAGNTAAGLFILAIGLFKKVFIADTFGPWVAKVFDDASTVSFADAWGATLAFALQIYFDFSGYCDMAIGLALLFNIVLPENFDSPYKAQSILDFWRRWHMTLTRFLRDYVFVPLARRPWAGPYAGLVVTMLLAGLWHGAGWTFVLFGALHGVYAVINTLWRRSGWTLPPQVSWAITFTALLVSFVLFRAPSFERAQIVFAGLFGLNAGTDVASDLFNRHEWKRILPALALVLLAPNRRQIMQWPWRIEPAYAAAFAVLGGVSILCLGDPTPFFYMRF
jgi:alginate O-acetyltransferase complex protein AlgI